MFDRLRNIGGVINLWDLRTRGPIGRLKGHKESCESLAFSPDGKTLATGGENRDILLWDVESSEVRGRLLPRKGEPMPVPDTSIRCLRFRRDGKVLAALDDRTQVQLWDVTDEGKLLRSYEPPGGRSIFDVRFTPDDALLVLAYKVVPPYNRYELSLWDASTDERPLWSLMRPTTDFGTQISPDCRTVAPLDDRQNGLWSKAFDPTVDNLLLGARYGAIVTRYRTLLPVGLLRFSPDGARMALSICHRNTIEPGLIGLVDVQSGRSLGSVGVPSEPSWMEFSPDGRLLASGEVYESVTIRKVADIIEG